MRFSAHGLFLCLTERRMNWKRGTEEMSEDELGLSDWNGWQTVPPLSAFPALK
jgi:hypothetical protein